MLKLNGKKIEINRFPDGTLLLKEDVLINFRDCRETLIEWFFESNEELITLVYIVKHLRSHGVIDLFLRMPYIPNARQDRVKKNRRCFHFEIFCRNHKRLIFQFCYSIRSTF